MYIFRGRVVRSVAKISPKVSSLPFKIQFCAKGLWPRLTYLFLHCFDVIVNSVAWLSKAGIDIPKNRPEYFTVKKHSFCHTMLELKTHCAVYDVKNRGPARSVTPTNPSS